MGEPWKHYAKLYKSATKSLQMLYEFIYLNYLE